MLNGLLQWKHHYWVSQAQASYQSMQTTRKHAAVFYVKSPSGWISIIADVMLLIHWHRCSNTLQLLCFLAVNFQPPGAIFTNILPESTMSHWHWKVQMQSFLLRTTTFNSWLGMLAWVFSGCSGFPHHHTWTLLPLSLFRGGVGSWVLHSHPN